jgi:hypothetical protein
MIRGEISVQSLHVINLTPNFDLSNIYKYLIRLEGKMISNLSPLGINPICQYYNVSSKHVFNRQSIYRDRRHNITLQGQPQKLIVQWIFLTFAAIDFLQYCDGTIQVYIYDFNCISMISW